MKKLLNTLFVTQPDSYVAREGEAVVVKVENEVKLKVPIRTIGGLVVFGYTGVSPSLMELCAEHGVHISFLTEHGRFLARVTGPVTGNVLLRREQYRAADEMSESASISRCIVAAKIANSRTTLQRALRDHPSLCQTVLLQHVVDKLDWAIESLSSASDLDTIRGIEGDASRAYFSVFDNLIVDQKADFSFSERNRRPPLDNVNALLSFSYTLLMHDVESACESVGLDPAVGFLHRDRSGRPGLALDLMEEFRSCIADRLVLSLINRRQINSTQFTKTESGAVIMNSEARKTLIVDYQNRKQEEITHPYLREKIKIGLLPFAQSLILARYLRGDIDGYPPYVWK